MTKRVAKDKSNKTNDIYKDPKSVDPPKKKKGKLPMLLIIILVLVAAAVIFKEPIMNMARQIPGIGKLLPKEETEGKNLDEVLDNNRRLEEEVARLEKEVARLEDSNHEVISKNEILKKYEQEQEDFIKQKNQWDKNIADQNTELFIEQFEQIYPDTAQEIYVRLKGNEIVSKEKAEVSKAIGEMDSEQAAKALEVLLTTDMELVKNIMLEMQNTQKSEILNSMSSEGAATIIKLIYP